MKEETTTITVEVTQSPDHQTRQDKVLDNYRGSLSHFSELAYLQTKHPFTQRYARQYYIGKVTLAEKSLGLVSRFPLKNTPPYGKATQQRIADAFGISTGSVERHERFASAIDAISEIYPYEKRKLLQGERLAYESNFSELESFNRATREGAIAKILSELADSTSSN